MDRLWRSQQLSPHDRSGPKLIGRVRGRLVDSELDGTLLIDVSGVGYEVLAPLDLLERIEADDAGLVTLYVHTYSREATLTLYGFASRDERSTFRTLIGVSKVGPKLALAVLGSTSLAELAQIVDVGPAARLTKVPGIGKRTAERMAVELRGKLGTPLTSEAPRSGPRQGDRGAADTLTSTLVRMGFKSSAAQAAVATMSNLERPMGELVREALSIVAP